MTESPGEITDLVGAAIAAGTTAEIVSTPGTLVEDLANRASSRVPYFISTGLRGEGVDDVFAFVLDEGQTLETIKLDDYLPELPRVAKGHVRVHTAQSFITFVGRHHHPDTTTLWSDSITGTVLAIFDDHPEAPAGQTMDHHLGQAQHRATLTMRPTPDWTSWTAKNDTLMGQEAFAEFLEDNAGIITSPPAATFIEIARTFTAKKGANFLSGFHTESGAVKFEYDETIAARAGHRGEVTIPSEFEIAVQPFEGSAFYPVLARFKYRMTPEGLKLGYRLIRPDVIRDAAFETAVAEIANALDVPILSANPGR